MNDILIYFIIGVVYDVAITYYYIEVYKEKWFGSGLMSILITVFQTLVLYNLITDTDILTNAIAYAIGCGVGTSLMVYMNHKKKHEQTSYRSAKRKQPARKIRRVGHVVGRAVQQRIRKTRSSV